MIQSEIEFILYVADQARSRDFYSALLSIDPTLDVPGMTEFALSASVKLGLMPESGIARILASHTPHPAEGSGMPRCELYLKVVDALSYLNKAESLGAKMISSIEPRDWGDKVGYVADLDGHIIAFAEKLG